MPRYKNYNYQQNLMVMINFKEQIQAETFEHVAHYLVDNKLVVPIFKIWLKENSSQIKEFFCSLVRFFKRIL